MCLIVDVQVAEAALLVADDANFGPINQALTAGRARMVYGGHLLTEYSRHVHVFKMIRLLDQAGRAHRVPDEPVDVETARLKNSNACKSNDEHIVALARVNRIRLLCSEDKALGADFRNKKLIDKPRGSVYKRRSHLHLLTQHCGDCCNGS